MCGQREEEAEGEGPAYRMSDAENDAPAPVNVVVAFRELQAKIKHVELDRLAAFRERDRLLADINEKKREQTMRRKEREMNSVDHLLERRDESDKLGSDITDLAIKTELINESYKIVQEDLDTKIDKFANLEAELAEIKSATENLIGSVAKRREELKDTEEKCKEMERQIELAPVFLSKLPHSPQKLEMELAMLESQLEEEKKCNEKASMRADALQNYLALVLQINGDLCNAMKDKEMSASKYARLSTRLLSSPKYAWPKELSDYQVNDKLMTKTTKKKKRIVKKKKNRVQKSTADGEMDKSYSRGDDDSIKYTEKFASGRGLSYPTQGATYANVADKAASTVVQNVMGKMSGASPQRAFIPGGNKDSKGYNVVAAVSKASREASALNAKVASKVKSFFADDSKELFKGIKKVGLNDMFDHLSTIKKIAAASGLSKENVYNEMLDLKYDKIAKESPFLTTQSNVDSM